ncbi:MAG: hypothetical protein ACKODT_07265 [Fluviibacter sp.]
MAGWIGWQPGMSGLPIQNAKKLLKKKFSYAKDLDDSAFFGWDLQQVLIRYQSAKNASAYTPKLRVDGILDYQTQVALGMVTKPVQRTVGTLFTVHGTGMADPLGPGYPADVARAVTDVWHWQPIGNYPAAVFPMGPSVEQGRAELKVQIRNHPGKIALAGYSQGAIVTSMVWKRDILDPGGELHDRVNDVVASVTWGNPCREARVANGNKDAGWPIPDGRGISDKRLEGTPDWWFDYAHGANGPNGRDIYTDTPDDDAGEDMTAIYKIVQNVSGFIGPGSLLKQLVAMRTNPLVEIPAAFRAIYFGGQFVTTQPFATFPHCNYDLAPAIRYLRSFK